MELKQIETYEFKELTDDIKEKVLNRFRENNDFEFLEGDLTEVLNEKLEENKIKVLSDLKLRYSLGYSQGDGLSFIGYFEFKGKSFCIKEGNLSNHYSHSKTTDIFLVDEDNDDTDDITEELNDILETEFKELYLNICDEVEKVGYSIIEDYNDDDNIKENIEMNEFRFLANGDIF